MGYMNLPPLLRFLYFLGGHSSSSSSRETEFLFFNVYFPAADGFCLFSSIVKKMSTSERISALSSSDRKLWSHLKSIVEEDENNIELGPDVQISKKEIKRELREEETSSSKEDTDYFLREFEKKKKKNAVPQNRREKERMNLEKHTEEERPSMLDALKMLDPKSAEKSAEKRAREPIRRPSRKIKKKDSKKDVDMNLVPMRSDASHVINTSPSQLRKARKEAKLFFAKRIKSETEKERIKKEGDTDSKDDQKEKDEKWWERSREERHAIVALRTPLETSADDELKRIQNDRITRFGVRTSPEVKDEAWKFQHQRISDISARIDQCATQVRRNRDQNLLNLKRLTELDRSRLLSKEKEIMKRAHNVVAQVAQYCTTATSRTSPDRNRPSSELLADDSYKSTLPYVARHVYKNPSDAGLNLPNSLFSARRTHGAYMFRKAYAFEPGTISGSLLRRHVHDATSYARIEGNIADLKSAMRGV